MSQTKARGAPALCLCRAVYRSTASENVTDQLNETALARPPSVLCEVIIERHAAAAAAANQTGLADGVIVSVRDLDSIAQ